jgi:hypothetical protein
MPTVHFLGKVLPQVVQVSLGHKPIVKWEAPDVGLSMEFTNHIINSEVDVECALNRYTSEDFELAYVRAFDICRASVGLASFAMGYGLTVILETFVDPSGSRSPILAKDERVASLCTAFTLTNGFDEVHTMVLQDWRLSHALHDLIAAITLPHISPVNCARVVERLRELIASPGSNRKNAWKEMQDALQVDEAYLKFITEHSVEPRHGLTVHIPGSVTTEVTRRAWTIMNRYFEYRKNGSKPLSANRFPLLTG